jgi:hypothetical protein
MVWFNFNRLIASLERFWITPPLATSFSSLPTPLSPLPTSHFPTPSKKIFPEVLDITRMMKL